MVESTCFQHTSSHPDKYNNSVNRIISKEKEREDIQGEILQSSSTVVFPHSTKKSNILQRTTRNPTSFESSRAKKNYSTYRINSTTRNLQEILQLQGSSRAHRYKASSSNCSPWLQAFYTAESSHKAPTA